MAAPISPHPTPVSQSVYLSYLLNSPVVSADGKYIGLVYDLLILNAESPRVMACLLKKRDGSLQKINWDGLSVNEEDRAFRIICKDNKDYSGTQNLILLKKQILDQQIIDINDKKVVRVNDIRLAFLSTGVFAVAVDVGLSGLLRRLGIVEIANFLAGFLGRSTPSRFILWKDIGVLIKPSHKIKLSVSMEKLNHLHPSDLSDIIEELDSNTRKNLFTALDEEKAADVLEELKDDTKISLVEDLPVEKAADVLEKMPSDEVADILDEINSEHAEQLLNKMDEETSSEVRKLMEYPEGSVGSFMSTDFVAFASQKSVGEALLELRQQKPESDTIYSIYVTDESSHLLGAISLPYLVTADLATPLGELMNKEVHAIHDNDDLGEIVNIIGRYTMLGVPVVDADNRLVGTIVIDDVFYRMLRTAKVSL